MRAYATEPDETYIKTPEVSGPTTSARRPAPAASHEASTAAESTLTPTPVTHGSTPAPTRPTNATRDTVRLLVQSPSKLFFYWSFAHDPRPALRAALGDAAGKFRPAVRLVETDGEVEREPNATDGDENNFWFDVLPGRAYRAEFGFHAEGLPFVRLLSSSVVETPAAAVSAESDPAPEYGIGEREFARVLEVSGFKPARLRAASDSLAAPTDAPGNSELPSSSSRITPPARRSEIF